MNSIMGGRKIFVVVPLYFFGSKSTIIIVVLVSAFVMVSIIWSVCCLLFFYSLCSRALCKSGGHVPPVLWSRPYSLSASMTRCVRHAKYKEQLHDRNIK